MDKCSLQLPLWISHFNPAKPTKLTTLSLASWNQKLASSLNRYFSNWGPGRILSYSPTPPPSAHRLFRLPTLFHYIHISKVVIKATEVSRSFKHTKKNIIECIAQILWETFISHINACVWVVISQDISNCKCGQKFLEALVQVGLPGSFLSLFWVVPQATAKIIWINRFFCQATFLLNNLQFSKGQAQFQLLSMALKAL